MTPEKFLQALSNAVAAAIGIFVGLALSDFEGVELWLSRWQTMIAGILAVVAASFAVIVAIIMDGRQQRRHDQTQKLALRREIIILERALPAAASARELLNAHLPPIIEHLRHLDAQGVRKPTLPARALSPKEAITQLRYFQTHDQILAAVPYFPLNVYEAYTWATEGVAHGIKGLQVLEALQVDAHAFSNAAVGVTLAKNYVEKFADELDAYVRDIR